MKKRLQILIAGRLCLAFLLLATVAIFNLVTSQQIVWSLAAVAALVCLLSIAYLYVLRQSTAYERQGQVQILIDILIVTGLVYLTGDIISPLSALYLISILVASSILKKRAVFAIASASALSYGAVSALVVDQVIPPGNLLLKHADLSFATTISTVVLHMIGFFVVAALSCHLAARLQRSASDLESATRRLANLTAYNDRVIDSISSGLITVELDGTVVTFNPAAQEISGFSYEEVQGKPLASFFPKIAAEALSLASRPAGLCRSERLLAIEKNSAGEIRHLGFSIAPLVTEPSTPLGFVIALQDLTEIIKLEEQMRRKERLAALGQMAAAIAHEIRNPLASMRGSIQALQSELVLDPEQTTLMDIVLRESDRLNKIITDFLAYARPAPASPTLVDLKEILSETLRLLTRGGEATAAHEIEETHPDESVPYVADPSQLRQVCWNLAKNAIHAMPSGGTLRVSLHTESDGDVVLRFQDTGIGMTEEQMEHIFEPFNSNRMNGTGMGMAIVHQIVANHHGRISVTSERGRGTTIEIRLPAVFPSRASFRAAETIQRENLAS